MWLRKWPSIFRNDLFINENKDTRGNVSLLEVIFLLNNNISKMDGEKERETQKIGRGKKICKWADHSWANVSGSSWWGCKQVLSFLSFSLCTLNRGNETIIKSVEDHQGKREGTMERKIENFPFICVSFGLFSKCLGALSPCHTHMHTHTWTHTHTQHWLYTQTENPRSITSSFWWTHTHTHTYWITCTHIHTHLRHWSDISSCCL